MDIHCSTCNEPWDTYHIQHEAVFDTQLEDTLIQKWKKLPTSMKLTPSWRQEFKNAGWEFGSTLFNIKHCPCCPVDAKINVAKDMIKSSLETLLPNDPDGLSSTMEDFRL